MWRVQQLGLQIKEDYYIGGDKSSVTSVWDSSSVCVDQSNALGAVETSGSSKYPWQAEKEIPGIH